VGTLNRNVYNRLCSEKLTVVAARSIYVIPYKTLLYCGQDSKCYISVEQLPKSAIVHLKYNLETRFSWKYENLIEKKRIFKLVYFVKYCNISRSCR